VPVADLPSVDSYYRGQKAWDSAFLDHMRCVGDPPADDAVDAMLRANASNPEDTARLLLRQLLGGGHHNVLLQAPGTELLARFIHEERVLPSWAERAQVERAQAIGREHMVVGSVLLAVASLPECYLDAKGASVLAASGQLNEQPARRLRHTAHMVFSVCAPHGIYPRPGSDAAEIPVAITKALTVRLMHALLRRFTTEGYRLPEQFYRQVEQDLGLEGDHFGGGELVPVPINQEDLAYVLLTFSYVVIRGLERMGVVLDASDRNAYVHLWNVIGHLMGVQRELMPTGYDEAASLFHALKQRLAGPSEEGRLLMAAMMGWINRLVPRPLRPFNPAAELVVHFVGRESAAMLGIEQRGLRWLRHRLFTLPLDGWDALKPEHIEWSPLSLLVQRLAGPMVRGFMAEVSSPRPPPPGHAGGPQAPRPAASMEWPAYVIERYGDEARASG
jgi:ER-bound oxygenase mpaB/B'/Rubber oxygenase, catalytic domain